MMAPMARMALRWAVPYHDVHGPLLEAAVAAMNEHGPFSAEDPEVELAPRWVALVDGRFVVVSPASSLHAHIVALVCAELQRRAPAGLVLAHAPVLTNGGRTVREADVALFVGKTAADLATSTFPDIVPDLVLEVLSPSTAAEDRGPKRLEYAAIGVLEYVLLDPKARACEALVLRSGRYVAARRRRDGWPSVTLGGAWDPVAVLP
jgi:Uma2 family endonuclease